MMNAKETFEDKFARKYYCNSYRFVHVMKKRNRKELRRKLKNDLMNQLNRVLCFKNLP